MGSNIKDFKLTFISNILILLAGIGSQSCLAWFLGTDGRGEYAVCLSYATMLSILCVVGCDIASIYFVSSEKFTLSEGITYAFIYGGLGSILAVILGMLFMQFQWTYFDKAEPVMFYLALASIPFSLFSTIYRRIITAMHDFTEHAVIASLQPITILVLIIVFVRIMGFRGRGAFIALIVGRIIDIVISLSYLKYKYHWTVIAPKLSQLKMMFNYGIRYHLGKISNQTNMEIGTIILGFMASKEIIGVFAVASQLAMRTMVIPDTLITVLIPKVSNDKTGKPEMIAKCFRISFIISVIVLSFLALIAKPLIVILFSEDFVAAASVFRVIAIGVLVRSACKAFVPYFLGTDRPGTSSISVAIGAISNICMMLIFMPLWGIYGAAIAMAISYILSSIILFGCFKYYSGLGFKQIVLITTNDWQWVLSKLKIRKAN